MIEIQDFVKYSSFLYCSISIHDTTSSSIFYSISLAWGDLTNQISCSVYRLLLIVDIVIVIFPSNIPQICQYTLQMHNGGQLWTLRGGEGQQWGGSCFVFIGNHRKIPTWVPERRQSLHYQITLCTTCGHCVSNFAKFSPATFLKMWKLLDMRGHLHKM